MYMHQAGTHPTHQTTQVVTLIITGGTVTVIGPWGKMATRGRIDVIRGVGEEKGFIV